MNLYNTVASNNPYFVKSLAHKYGHELKKEPNLPFVLEQLVAIHGEQALREIINVHPDKELFKDFFSKNEKEEIKVNATGDITLPCPCPCRQQQDYLNITGSEMLAKNKELVTNTNLLVFAGAIVIAFAILNLK